MMGVEEHKINNLLKPPLTMLACKKILTLYPLVFIISNFSLVQAYAYYKEEG